MEQRVGEITGQFLNHLSIFHRREKIIVLNLLFVDGGVRNQIQPEHETTKERCYFNGRILANTVINANLNNAY